MKTTASLSLLLAMLASLSLSSLATAEVKDVSAQSKMIGKLIDRQLAAKQIKPNAPINDELFVRRIYLTAVGRIPSGAEIQAFMSSDEKNKRDRLVDELLESEGYVSHFYNYWADILRINSRLGRSSASNEYAYKHWIKESLRSNKPYDKMVYELLSAEGDVWDNGATGYYHRDRGMPLDNMANTVRVFLGTRLECAQCHDHPFDEWTQQDFFHMASFTFGVRPDYVGGNRTAIRDSMNKQRRELTKTISLQVSGIKGFYPYRRDSDITKIYASDDRRSVARRCGIATADEFRAINNKVMAALNENSQETYIVNRLVSDIYNPLRYATVGGVDKNAQLPHDYQYDDAKPNQEVAPAVMFGDVINDDALEDGYLKAYAGWMTAKSNPRFTQVIANRLWKKAFGIGLVEPVDQLTAETAASNSELMDYLEQCMKDLDYDMKSFLAMIYKSEAWQRQSCVDEIAPGTPFYFPGPAMQRMSAEQIWDSLAALTIPDVDHYQPKLVAELRSIDRDHKIRDALESHTPEEFQKIVEKLAVEVAASYETLQVVRDQYLKARQDEDADQIRKLSAELKKLTNAMRKRISEVAYKGADGSTDDPQALIRSAGMSEMTAAGQNASGERYVRTQLPRVSLNIPEGLSKPEKSAWVKKNRNYTSSWGNLARGMMRASELPTPAPRGHFLREFGQSDRELIQNANRAASVPQALSLMNSSVAETLRHPYSVLGQALAQCDTPQQEIDTMYRLLFTRQPTENETNRLLHEYETNPKTAQANIIWALLNTQQFIFIR